MLHGIKVILENSQRSRNLLKEFRIYPIDVHCVAVSFSFEDEDYYSNFEKFISTLVFNDIPYLKIQF